MARSQGGQLRTDFHFLGANGLQLGGICILAGAAEPGQILQRGGGHEKTRARRRIVSAKRMAAATAR